MNEISLIDAIESVLSKVPEQRHSYFQLKHFILDKEPCHQGKLWQCLREIQSRKDSIENVEIEIDEIKDKISLLDLKIEKEKLQLQDIYLDSSKYHDICLKESEIKERKLLRNKTILKKNLDKLGKKLGFLQEEVRFLLDCYESLTEIEPVKNYDDIEAQTEYWNEKLSQEVTLRSLLQLPLDAELAKTILALADTVPIKDRLVNSFKHISKQLNMVQARYLEAMKESDEKTTV